MINIPRTIIFLLLFFSIFRVFLIPLGGTANASLIAGLLNILTAFQIIFYSKLNFDGLLLFSYAILMIIPSFFYELTLFEIFISFLETITPIIIFSASTNIVFLNKLGITKRNFQRFLSVIIFLLLLGHLLTLIGFDIPSIRSVPISTWGSESGQDIDLGFIRSRVASFVGTSGPYSNSMAYLFIAFSILIRNQKLLILVSGLIVQLLSFSRIGFAILFIYFVISEIEKIKIIFNIKFHKFKVNNLLFFIFTLIPLIYFIFSYKDILSFQIERVFYLFTLANDVSNQVRINRMDMAITQIYETIFSPIIGSGTGITARSIGGNQYESQIVKILVEWGLIGLSIFIYWLFKIIKTSFNKAFSLFDPEFLALILTIIFNLFVIQALTSAPIISSISLTLMANTLVKKDIPKKDKRLIFNF
tara:strand:- start:8901 stop:10154 length:1254 start_codon:yes stop_codon:yes gene_type:complete